VSSWVNIWVVTLAGGQRERTNMQSITVEVSVADAYLWGLVEDVPWTQYPWWGVYGYPSNDLLMVDIRDPQDEDRFISKAVRVEDVAAAISALPYASNALLNDQLDSADTFDEVMQVAVLGEVVYS
jgi:hypothetical protein